jgi:hypothetical protein
LADLFCSFYCNGHNVLTDYCGEAVILERSKRAQRSHDGMKCQLIHPLMSSKNSFQFRYGFL